METRERNAWQIECIESTPEDNGSEEKMQMAESH